MKKLWKGYTIEIIAGLIVLLGIFLLVEPFEIRKTIFAWGARLMQILDGVAKKLMSSARHLTPSDALGLIFIALAGAFIVWRVRYHFVRATRWVADECPKCHSPLHRVHRTLADQVVGRIFLPHARRYRCDNPQCRWTGLRHGAPHRHHRRKEEATAPENSQT